MSEFDNIGKLMHLPLKDIEPGQEIEVAEFIIIAAAEMLHATGDRNWIPLIVKELGNYRYQVVSNPFVYVVAQRAELERVWCIVIESDSDKIEQAQVLAQERIPKINLTTASRTTILSALQYLMKQPGSALTRVDEVVAANRIAEAKRQTWSDFEPITKLRCGITKTRIRELGKIFYLSPPPPPPPAPKEIDIKLASREEIFERINYLVNYQIGGFEVVEPEKVADAIFSANKSKWKTLNPIAKLEVGIDRTKIKVFKNLLTL